MVTRQNTVPYIRSPYLREKLEHPKAQLAHALVIIEELRHSVGISLFTLKQLTETLSGVERQEQPDDGSSDGKDVEASKAEEKAVAN